MSARLAIFLSFGFIAVISLTGSLSAQTDAVNGTWSGSWQPKGGVMDSITVEFNLESSGKFSGKFRTPAPMDFSKAAFNKQTGTITAEAADEKTGKQYRLEGKIQGMEFRGTLSVNDVTGEVRLIKWTFVPR